MHIFLLVLFLLLMTPISCCAEIRQAQGVRFRVLLRIWGIPLRIDHTSAPVRPKAPSPRQLRAGKHLLRALPKMKRPIRLLLRRTTLQVLLVQVSLSLRDPAQTALTAAFLAQLRLLLPESCRGRVRIAITPDFLHEKKRFLAARCIISLRLGTIVAAAAMALTAWKEESAWNIPSAS